MDIKVHISNVMIDLHIKIIILLHKDNTKAQ